MAIKRFILPINASGPIQNLRTTSVTQTTIALAWDVYPGATGYEIRRGTQLVHTITSGSTTTWTNSSYSAGTTYTLSVRPVVGGSGVASAQASIVVTTTAADVPYSPTTWGGVVLTEAQHNAVIPGTNNPHFERTWFNSGGWNGEGYMRWRVAYTQGEDADGYSLIHPATTTRGIYLSFVGRIGQTWWQHHASADRFKFVMFYPQAQTNPRPTIFNMPIFAGDGGAYSYRTWGPDLEAGGAGVDEFGTGAFDWNDNYPSHQYKESPVGTDWFFYVMALLEDRTAVWLWNRQGPVIGAEAASIGQTFYARSRQANSSMLSSWNAQSWTNPRLLAYIEATTAGDANAYMDIGRIRVTQSLPAPPAGFVTG